MSRTRSSQTADAADAADAATPVRPQRPQSLHSGSNSIEALVDHLADRIAQRVTDRLAADAADATEPWLSVKQAAEHIGAPTSRIYDLVAQGHLHPGRDGKRLAFRRTELDRYMTGTDRDGCRRPSSSTRGNIVSSP